MASFAIMHLIGIAAGVVAILGLESLNPKGAEGGWLTRIYLGAIFAATAIANLAFLIIGLCGKGNSGIAVAFRAITVAAPILLCLWLLLRG
jgi:hypothetical protein